jgi:hypothetical protein
MWTPWRKRSNTPETLLRQTFDQAAEAVAMLCQTCSIFHRLPKDVRQAVASADGFSSRHEGHLLSFSPGYLATVLRFPGLTPAWRGNADIKLAFQAVQSMTVTNLHSLASSVTAGWQGAVVDNTSNLFLDALVQAVIDYANTAPANSRGVFWFAYHGLDTTYTNPATGSEGTITLVDVTANAQSMPDLGFLPYTTQDEIAEGPAWSVAATTRGGILTPKWGVAAINHSGASTHSSGNSVSYRGVYATVI